MKPHYSKVEITNDASSIRITIPPTGWGGEGVSIVVLIVSILVFAAMVYSLFSASILVSFLLLLGTAASVTWFLWFLKGTTELRVDSNKIQRTLKLFGKGYPKSHKASQLKYINVDKVFENKEDGGIAQYGIIMHFENDKKLIFGTRLDDRERKWILHELLDMTDGSIQN